MDLNFSVVFVSYMFVLFLFIFDCRKPWTSANITSISTRIKGDIMTKVLALRICAQSIPYLSS